MKGDNGQEAGINPAWEKPVNLFYTDADQQRLHPGDKGMEFVAELSTKEIMWPRAEFKLDPRG